MKITVWSSLSGKLSGHLVMKVPGTHTVHKLLETYCSHKGVSSLGYVMRSRDSLLLNPNKSLEQSNIHDGETLTIGLSDDEEQTFAFGSWTTVTITALLIGTIGLTLTVWAFLEPIKSSLKYGVVMDAGSSHSEIFVFSWHGEKPFGTADVTLIHRCFMQGGVSSFIGHADSLGRYLEKCLEETKHSIPVTSHMGTLFYVGATAGMRILRDFNPDGANLILETLREVLITKTPFSIDHDNIEILEGSEEGASGWTAVNYLLGNLKKDTNSTAAALDVGGASMQISRVIIDNGTWAPENLTLFGDNYSVLSQSFLCYGIGEAQHRYDYFLVHENETVSEEEVFIDPCLAKGIMHNLTAHDLNVPCTRTDESKPLLSGGSHVKWHKIKSIYKNYRKEIEVDGKEADITKFFGGVTTEISNISNNEILNTIVTQGSSNASRCDKKMNRLFNLKLCKKTFTYGDCMNSESIPAITGDFVAFSGWFEQLMWLLKLKQGVSLREFKEAIFEVCTLNSEDLYKRYSGLPKVLVEDICFDAVYLYNLLTVGLGIDKSKWMNIQFTDEINNTEVDWPLGFMMNRTTLFPADIPGEKISIPVFVLLLFLFAAFLMSGIMFFWHSRKIKKQSASYQRVLADNIDEALHKFI